MIDLTQERPLTFNEAAAFLPSGSRPNHSTWWRWWRHGVRGARLETVLVGGRRFTTAEAVLRFIAATTFAAPGELPPSRTPRQRRVAHRQARRKLLAAGIASEPVPGETTSNTPRRWNWPPTFCRPAPRFASSDWKTARNTASSRSSHRKRQHSPARRRRESKKVGLEPQ